MTKSHLESPGGRLLLSTLLLFILLISSALQAPLKAQGLDTFWRNPNFTFQYYGYNEKDDLYVDWTLNYDSLGGAELVFQQERRKGSGKGIDHRNVLHSPQMFYQFIDSIEELSRYSAKIEFGLTVSSVDSFKYFVVPLDDPGLVLELEVQNSFHFEYLFRRPKHGGYLMGEGRGVNRDVQIMFYGCEKPWWIRKPELRWYIKTPDGKRLYNKKYHGRFMIIAARGVQVFEGG